MQLIWTAETSLLAGIYYLKLNDHLTPEAHSDQLPPYFLFLSCQALRLWFLVQASLLTLSFEQQLYLKVENV